MHPRNRFKEDYDFDALAAAVPELKTYLRATKSGSIGLDFKHPLAVKFLNQALLKTSYGIDFWDIPEGYLCPPVPGRLDYLLHLADLLAAEQNGTVPVGKSIRLLDIGCGANCIYPILARGEWDWRCVATEVDAKALKVASAIVRANKLLHRSVELRHQQDPMAIFRGVTSPDEAFDCCVCNPPFYASQAEAERENQEKWRKLKRPAAQRKKIRNFGGQGNELWTRGGEKSFAMRFIRESRRNPRLCRWFSILLAKKKHELPVQKALREVGAERIKVIPLRQGNKESRIIAWQYGR